MKRAACVFIALGILLIQPLGAQRKLELTAGLVTQYEDNLFRGPNQLITNEGDTLLPTDFHTNAWSISPELSAYYYRKLNKNRLRLRGSTATDWYPSFNLANRYRAQASVSYEHYLKAKLTLLQEAGFKMRQRFQPEEGLPNILSFPYNFYYAYYEIGPEFEPLPDHQIRILARGMRKKMSDENTKGLGFWEAGLKLHTRQDLPNRSLDPVRLELEVDFFQRYYRRTNPLFDPTENILVLDPDADTGGEIQNFLRRYWRGHLKATVPFTPRFSLEAGLYYRDRHNPSDPRFDFYSWKPSLELNYEIERTELSLDASWMYKNYRTLIPAGFDRSVRYRHWRLTARWEQQLHDQVYLQTAAHYQYRQSDADRLTSLAFRSYTTWGLEVGFFAKLSRH